jgi:hypothetical protein
MTSTQSVSFKYEHYDQHTRSKKMFTYRISYTRMGTSTVYNVLTICIRYMQKFCKVGVGKIGIRAKKYMIFYVITNEKGPFLF